MNQKLILLNGPLGIGKSSLANMYAEEHPLTLILDIDNVWTMISHWRQNKDISGPISNEMALAMAEINLRHGHDVIIPQIILTNELVLRFDELAKNTNSDFYEILLDTDKEESIKRFKARSINNGHPTGFRAGGLIDMGGRETMLREMYDTMSRITSTRPNTIRIKSIAGDINHTYAALISHLI